MKMRVSFAATMLMLGSCGPQRQAQEPANYATAPAQPEASAQPAVTNTAPPARPAPKPTVDPKSSEAAEELVRSLVGLLNEGKFNEAYMLLGPNAPPRAEFDNDFSRYSDLQVTAGAAGDQEGAAGSIYLSLPLTVSGRLAGKRSSRGATAILRRINDVPGSTEAQRHWHIERIDWGKTP